ncbi:MAG: SCO family protein [Verrucomicrobia bacterium]|nr:SCO family protein [Verrucomicrobiota bacterium]
MSEPARRLHWMIWFGVGTTVVLLLLSLSSLSMQRRAGGDLPDYGPIADFTLTNQAGQQVTLIDLRGKVWVADIIFTRCAGPCVKMTRQMKELQDALASSSAVHLVSLTTDPTFDTPAVLHQYSQRFTADSSRWSFLTGTPSQIASLAAGSLKLTALEKAPKDRETPEDLFIHSTIFVLVDRHSRLRGVFETTGDDIDPAAIKAKILGAVHALEKEL